MSGLQRILLAAASSSLASVILMAVYARAVGLGMPSSAWIFTALAPFLVTAPIALYLVRQGEYIRRLNDDLRVAYARLSRLASTDDLTGLANRRSFLETAAAARQGGADWLLLADIDHFKSINDRFGHERGDAFLEAVAGILSDAVSDGIVGRLGGEEFALLLSGASAAEALAAAETIREQVGALALSSDDGCIIATTVSVGLTACHAGGSLQDDLKRADTALYRAKRSGRDQVRLHSDSDDTGRAGRRPLAVAS